MKVEVVDNAKISGFRGFLLAFLQDGEYNVAEMQSKFKPLWEATYLERTV